MTGRVEVVTNDGDARRPLLSRPASDIDLDMATLDTRHGHEKWRRIVGLLLLFTTVVLWTASNFMASVCAFLLFLLLFARRLLTRALDTVCRQHLLEALSRHLR